VVFTDLVESVVLTLRAFVAFIFKVMFFSVFGRVFKLTNRANIGLVPVLVTVAEYVYVCGVHVNSPKRHLLPLCIY